MNLLAVLSNIFHTITVGLMLIFTNLGGNSPTPILPPAPTLLPPSGTIVLTPTTTSPIDLSTLIPSPFKEVEKPKISTITFPSAKKLPAVETPTTPGVQSKPEVKPAPAPVPTVETPKPTPLPEIEQQETIAPQDINAQTRASIVNILCNVGGEGSLDPISGTGIIIDSAGIVLTNAHVGQFFLLRDYPTKNNIDCVLRTGNPARPLYRAELLYFPLAWMKTNADKIIQDAPTGTGERDYSLLHITGKVDGSALPASFPYLSPYTGDSFSLGDETLLAGYPAGFIEGMTIQTSLYVSSAFGKIQEIFTFKEGGGADLISVPGTIVSQRGASGGAAVRSSDGKLIGLIATATGAAETSQRDLRAITLAHIDRSLTEDTGHNLHYLLTNDPGATARLFNLSTAPTLTRMLTNVLDR